MTIIPIVSKLATINGEIEAARIQFHQSISMSTLAGAIACAFSNILLDVLIESVKHYVAFSFKKAKHMTISSFASVSLWFLVSFYFLPIAVIDFICTFISLPLSCHIYVCLFSSLGSFVVSKPDS